MGSKLETLRGSKVRRTKGTVKTGEVAWVDAPIAAADQLTFVTWRDDCDSWHANLIPVLTLEEAEAHRPTREYIVHASTPQQANFAVRRGHGAIVGARPNSPATLWFPLESDTTRSDLNTTNAPIAVIGVGAVMPGASDAKQFWANIQAGVSAVSEVPDDRWKSEFFYNSDRNVPDKTYSKIGGWITDFEFDRKQFRLPPSVISKIDPTQLVCLASTREALADAGYLDREFDRDRCAVILGNAMGGDLRDQTTMRVHYDELEADIRDAIRSQAGGKLSDDEIEAALAAAAKAVKGKLAEVNEDSMPGELANVIAGRVASAFDLRGPNFVVDAACASALAAIETAVRGLRAGQYDMAVTGGADRTMGPSSFVKFSKIGALSADGSRPFDESANGFVMGEGAGILVLKRLSDAERDGDQIYAVIRGVAGSSDGKGKGITAPNPRGQILAMRRAWDDAGLSPRTATLIEAHGTSTPVGDPTEVQSLREVLDTAAGEYVGDISLGSVKSMIGHLKSAAGAAGMIKVVFALRDGVLPPTINVTKPNPAMGLDGTRIKLQTKTEPWKINGIRRAGVSAFGFGGTNFHVVLEEYSPNVKSNFTSLSNTTATQKTETPMSAQAAQAGVVALTAATVTELIRTVDALCESIAQRGMAAASAFEIRRGLGGEQHRLAIAYTSAEDLGDKLTKARKALQTQKGWKVLANQGIIYSDRRIGGLVAMLSPGQGSQYLQMGAELARIFPVVAQTFAEADAVMQPILGRTLSSVIAPDMTSTDEASAFIALSQTEITQPAVLTVDVAIARLLGEFGIAPDIVAGHSLGEYGACVAAGVMSFADALRTVAARGSEMAKATPMNGDCGIMASVPATLEVVEQVLAEIDGYVVCANKNCPGQTIIAGLTQPTTAAIKRFEEMGYQVVQLPVSHAFHSEVVASASAPLRKHLNSIHISTPQIPILTNVTGDVYPSTPGSEDTIRDLLARQVAAPVEYITMVERMYAMGARVFVEVGPKRAQQTFVQSILTDRDHIAIYTNHPKKGELASFFEALGQLWVCGAMDKAEAHVDAPVERAAMASPTSVNTSDVLNQIVAILCEKTGYDPAEIEPDFELEADLGIDTVKQAEIMAAVREIYGFESDDAFKLAEYPSLNHLVAYVVEKTGGGSAQAETAAPQAAPLEPGMVEAKPSHNPVPTFSHSEIVATMTRILCEKTGYDPAEIEPDFELEADLGIDTVKQAEIMAAARELYGFERDDSFRLAEYPSLNHLATYVLSKLGDAAPTAPAVSDHAISAPRETSHPVETAPAAKTVDSAAVVAAATADRAEILSTMTTILCDKTGYDPAEIDVDFELEADLGIDTVKQAEIMAAVREIYGFERDDAFKLAEYPTLARLADYVIERLGATAATATNPAATHATATNPAATHTTATNPAATHTTATTAVTSPARDTPHQLPVAITGCALGLPGDSEIFSDDTVDRLLEGQNFITAVSDEQKESFVAKRIVRLVKHKDGGGDMEEVTSTDEVIKLAGQPGRFDLAEWGLADRFIASIDDTSQLAIAAGLTALRDAGLPLVPRYHTTTTGKKITIGWTLPDEIADETGIIFASAFAGQDAIIEEVTASSKPDYVLNHRLLLRMLGIANSRFAEFVGARGPNTKINSACASTTTAIAMAQDWITLGRCKRVVILGADNASGPTLFEWIGAGFLATGAASTEARIEDAALPFDKRRNGMVVGMGAVALVVEQGGLAEARGLEPIAEVLGTRFVNSAMHPTRLDVDHIAQEVEALLSDVEAAYDIDRLEAAKKTVFVSHETYTPARGGSADAEIASLRRAYGENADDVVIANTKGFTGHAMGAGIEDVLAIKALQRRRLPHIANFKEPDPNLGNLRLSQGGEYDLDYALRLAAGFGSQLAVAFLRFRARTENRIVQPDVYSEWLARVSGFENPETFIESRTLRLRNKQPEAKEPVPVAKPSIPAPAAAAALVAALREDKPVDIRPQSVVAQAGTAARVDAARLTEALSGRHVVVLAGPMMVTDLVVRSLESFGARVDIINNGRTPLGEGVAVDLSDEAHIQSEFKSLSPIDGIVNLLGFGSDSAAAADVERAALHTFNVARAWFAIGGTPGAGTFFLSVTGMGGRLGFDRATGPLPLCGAVAGMTKSLAREWSESRIKVVDVAREGFYPELGRQILDALFDESNGVEVGVIGGVQWGPAYATPSEIFSQSTSLLPRPASVIIVTGGARGITAKVMRDLASRAPATYVLVGRTPFEGDEVLDLDMEKERTRIREELLARGERVTPMAIHRRLSKIMAQREIATTLNDLRATGSAVTYVSCDVADPASVKAMVENVRLSIGPITGFIHGAGVEESKFIQDKDRAGFDRVFKGKALGALALWEATRSELLEFAVFFSSVAGRFGNVAQADYSAANESLNKLAQLINATTKTRALSIDWTAWDDVGMATEGSMKQIMESRGIDLLPASQGAPMLADLLEAGVYGEVLVAGRLGDMFDGPVAQKAELATVSQTRERATFERTLSLDDPFMKDHVYEGNSLLPGVMGLEFMHEAARLLGHDSWVASDVKFDKAVKLLRGEPVTIRVTAEQDGDVIRARIESSRKSVTGRQLDETHFEASFTKTPDHVPAHWIIDVAQALEGPAHEAIYERFFHTGVFRVLEKISLITDNFVVARGRIPAQALIDGKDGGQVVTQPLLTEMMFQAIGVWGMVDRRVTSLPHRIASWELFRSVKAGELVSIRARKRDVTETHIIFDAEVRDEFGHLVAFAEGIELIIHQPLPDDLAFPVLEVARGELIRMTDPEARAWVADHGLSIEDMLGSSELESWNRFLSQRRRAEWFAARIAAKRGIAAWLRDVRGIAAHPQDIIIDKDENKAPFPTMRGAMLNYHGPLPHLSVSHSGGIAVVHIGVRPDMRIGIDLEAVEAREDSFATEYFTADELALGGDLRPAQRLTALWTIKESVSKALGLGLHVRLSEIVIEELDTSSPTWTANVRLINEAATSLSKLKGERMDVRIFDLGAFMLAEATFDATAEVVEVEELDAPSPDGLDVLAAVAALLHHKGLMKTTPRANGLGR